MQCLLVICCGQITIQVMIILCLIILAQYTPQSNNPTGGIFYYITAPGSFDRTLADPVHAIVYVLFLTAIVTVFGRLWVELGGLSAKAAAKNLLDADVQVTWISTIRKLCRIITKSIYPICYYYWWNNYWIVGFSFKCL